MIGSKTVVRVFIDDASVITDGAVMLRAISLAGPFIGVLYVAVSSMQAMGKALPATLISICRQGLVFIPALFIMKAVWEMTGIIYAQAVADYITIFVSIIVLVTIFRKQKSNEKVTG